MAARSKPFIVVREAWQQASGIRSLAGAVVAIGNFDGVHRGHRVVIAQAVARARALQHPAAALTFEPSPRSFFHPGDAVFRLTDETAKLRLMAATELDGVIVMRFDTAFAKLSAEEFIGEFLIGRLGVSGVVVGFDFHFGRDRAGTPDYLASEAPRRGLTVDIVAEVRNSERRYSSGAVRAALTSGDVAAAHELLGYPWFVSGEVIHGEKRGRDLGFPTANLRLAPGCGLRHGIYAVRVGVGAQRYGGVASFGRRPTFDNGAPLLEVVLFDFSGDLYGQTIDVAFIGWVRPELKFASVEALVERMNADAREARTMLAAAGDAFPPLGPLS
jgi:riboflavin kinase/FMN adenylyltransferase